MGTDGGMPLCSANLLDSMVGDRQVDFSCRFTCVRRRQTELTEQALGNPVVAPVFHESVPALGS